MAAHRFFSHTDPEGREPMDRLLEHDAPFELWGPWGWVAENCSQRATPSEAMGSLLGSPGHRRNMLHDGHTRIGVGWAVGIDGRTKAVQEFGVRAGD
jgi:uncharacterized protein YkwD